MVMEQSYSAYLKRLLSERCESNSRYSLRAFARDLGLSPSRVSEILSGKQGLSRQSAAKICQRLGLSEIETLKFVAMVQSRDSRSKKDREVAQKELMVFQNQMSTYQKALQLQLDTFKLMGDWYHIAIMELTALPKFKSDNNWIAKKLGISVHVVEAAVKRLLDLKLLELKNGKLTRTTQNVMTASQGVPSDAIKSFHKQILEKLNQALDFQALDEREVGCLQVALDPALIPKIKEKMRKFRRETNALIEKENKNPTEIYALSTYLFRLSTPETKE